MGFLRQRMQQTPGLAGGTLEEQLARALQNHGDINGGQGQALDNPGPQILAPQNQQAITRPRTVAQPEVSEGKAAPSFRDMLAQPQVAQVETEQTVQQAPEASPNAPFGSSGDAFGSSRPRRTQMRDFIADDSQYLRDLESQPRNWKDKTVDAIRALNTNFNGPSASPPTKRERGIAQAQGGLSRDIAVDKAQSDAALKDLIPVRLNDGSIVMTPVRSAGSLASQQQGIGIRADTASAHKKRWEQMGKHEATQDALRVYNSGGANDPETLKAISDTLELPATLKPKFLAGEIMPQVDDKGELQLVNKRDGSVVNTGVTSYETTKEAGRNTRQERAATAAMARTQALITAGIGKLGDPNVTETTAAELEDQAQEADDLAKELTDKGFPSQGAKAAERAVKLRQTITTLKEAANKARTAQTVVRATPRAARAQGATTNAPQGSFNLKGWITDHPDATKEQIQAQRSKAKARQLSIVE